VALQTGISANTGDRYETDAGKAYFDFEDGVGGGSERAIGATRGGCIFEALPNYKVVEADQSFGPVVGLRRIDGVATRLTINLLEAMTVDNILAAIAGSASADTSYTWVHGEYIGTGLELDGGIAPFGATTIDTATLEVYYTDAGLGLPTLGVLNTNYSVNAVTQAITRVGAVIADTDLITVTYRYDSVATGDDFDIITLAQLDASDYHDVALATEVSNSTLTNPAFFIVKNGLSINGLTLTTAPRAEAVTQLIFEGHFAAASLALANSPFEIWFPAT